jgi:hypothetical protein
MIVFRKPRLVLSICSPFEDLEDYDWLDNWIRIEVIRQEGATAGTIDRYFYSPGGRRVRSLIKANIYNRVLIETNGDEEVAFDAIGRSG